MRVALKNTGNKNVLVQRLVLVNIERRNFRDSQPTLGFLGDKVQSSIEYETLE